MNIILVNYQLDKLSALVRIWCSLTTNSTPRWSLTYGTFGWSYTLWWIGLGDRKADINTADPNKQWWKSLKWPEYDLVKYDAVVEAKGQVVDKWERSGAAQVKEVTYVELR